MNTALASVHPARATGSLATDGIDDPGTAHFAGSRRSKRLLSPVSLFVLMALGLCVAFPGYALDLVAFTGITGPLTSALTQIASLGPGIKALVGFVGFVVALISLAALRNFGPVLFYVGLAIFAAVGLVIAGAIMGAVI
ncbi:MAG TPA: hypothetical protein PKX14_16570 [Thauera aminoaromatica]|jgi:hypothetical protein|nr:hypothetical protein [Thauera aminoaromatica]HNF78404.1 hypothetical protein [Thauera aminoaromatica]HRD86323.1 hypothetical protein [Rubrivivax sp.]